MAPRKRFLKRFVIIFVALVALLFLVKGSVSLVYSQKLKTQIKRLEALGGSTDIKALLPPATPSVENAANLATAAGLLYEEPDEALARLRLVESARHLDREPGAAPPAPSDGVRERIRDAEKMSSVYEEILTWRGFDMHLTVSHEYRDKHPSSGTDWNDAWMPYLEKWLEENRIPLDLAKRAAEIGTASFDVDWDRGFEAKLPYLAMLRKLSRLLRIDAVVKAKKGDLAGAMDSVRLALRLRRLIDEQPTLIAALVSVSVDAAAFGSLRGVLECGRPDAESVRSVLEELEGREERNRLTHAFLGEAAVGLQAFEKVRANPLYLKSIGVDVEPLDYAPLRFVFTLVWIPSADEYNYARDMTRLVEISTLPFPEALDARWDIFRGEKRTSYLVVPYHFLSSMLEPALERAILVEAERDAETRMARTVLALALYKSDTGAYPETLDPLVPAYLSALQIDPFDGKPLRFARRGEGFVIYSVYRDKADDGGIFKGPKAESGDLTWERPN